MSTTGCSSSVTFSQREVVAHCAQGRRACAAEDRHVGTPLGQSLEDRLHRLRALAIGDDRDHRMIVVDHRQRAMQQVCAGERMGGHVGGLHQLQGGLTRRRVGVPTSGGHQSVGEPVARRQLRDLLAAIHKGLGSVGDRPGGCGVPAPEGVDDEPERQQLGGVRLGGRDRTFGTGQDVELQLCGVPEGTLGVVRDRKRRRAPGSRGADGLDEVRGATTLADREQQDVGEVRPGSVGRHRRGRGQASGEAEGDLDQVLRVQRRVVTRATRCEQDEPRAPVMDGRGEGAGPRHGLRGEEAGECLGLFGDLGGHQGAAVLGHR